MPQLRAVIFDVGGTLVEPDAGATPVSELRASFRPGTLGLLKALAAAGIGIGAVTDTSTMTEAEVRAALGPEASGLLGAVVTSVEVGAAKPDPAGVHRALERLGVGAHEALFVGDQPVDRDAADAAGVSFVAVDTEHTPATALRSHLRGSLGAWQTASLLRAPVDDEVRRQADDHHARLTKPPGSLGRLEALGAQLAAIAGRCPPPVPAPVAIAVFAGDHGVHAQGVSSWPQEVTAQMAANFLAGGAAINVLARHLGAAVAVVDVGIASSVAVPGTIRRSLEGGGLSRDPVWLDRRIRAGTSDLSIGPAMSTAEAQAALDIGVDVATQLAHAGARLLVTGDMGIANTTPAAALIAAYTGTDALAVTGRGAGIDGPTFGRKAKLVAQAAARVASLPHGPLGILAEVGGFEHAALAGYIIGAAGAGVPVVADGVIALSAVLAAEALSPGVKNWVIAGHRSSEPGATAALEHLGMQPILDLGLRLGEGSGAALAVPIVQAAALVMAEMATFDDAGVDRSPPEL